LNYNPDLKATIAAGFQALQQGNLPAARDSFTRAIATGNANANTWYGLSVVHRMSAELQQESDALDRCLTLNPGHIMGLIAKADRHAASGDSRAASSYYQTALEQAASKPSLSPEQRAALGRAEALNRQFAAAFEQHLLSALSTTQLAGKRTRRFDHALDLLLGKRQIYFQQPKYFFFPELAHIQFFDRSQFSWVPALEAKTSLIRAELQSALARGTGFEPYIKPQADRPNFNPRGLLNNADWSAHYLIRSGVQDSETAALFPHTMAALSTIPLCQIPGRTPSVLFSLLRPGAHIRPHHGFTNFRLICHLPLLVPDQCGLRVGNEVRPWREGELLIFDDSIEHEAWNRSNEIRVVLLFDIWRPELSQDERTLLSAMLTSIDRFGPRGEWSE
jgi:Tfp pilus assembly protein PilF